MEPSGSGLGTTDHFVPFHRSVRLPEVSVPTAMQLLLLVHATPSSPPATADVAGLGCGAATATAADEPSTTARPATSEAPAARANLRPDRLRKDIPEMPNMANPPTPRPETSAYGDTVAHQIPGTPGRAGDLSA